MRVAHVVRLSFMAVTKTKNTKARDISAPAVETAGVFFLPGEITLPPPRCGVAKSQDQAPGLARKTGRQDSAPRPTAETDCEDQTTRQDPKTGLGLRWSRFWELGARPVF